MKIKKSNNGFTIAEVISSMLILALALPVFLSALEAYKFVAHHSRHKLQAAFVAQRIIEEKRRTTFANLATANYGVVSIDTNGTFNATADDFMGNATVTVTNLDAYRKRVMVQVTWQEHSPVGAVPMSEYCTTDIANELQLN